MCFFESMYNHTSSPSHHPVNWRSHLQQQYAEYRCRIWYPNRNGCAFKANCLHFPTMSSSAYVDAGRGDNLGAQSYTKCSSLGRGKDHYKSQDLMCFQTKLHTWMLNTTHQPNSQETCGVWVEFSIPNVRVIWPPKQDLGSNRVSFCLRGCKLQTLWNNNIANTGQLWAECQR